MLRHMVVHEFEELAKDELKRLSVLLRIINQAEGKDLVSPVRVDPIESQSQHTKATLFSLSVTWADHEGVPVHQVLFFHQTSAYDHALH